MVPITSLISLLVGMIVAFEAAEQLAKFGAQIYVVKLGMGKAFILLEISLELGLFSYKNPNK